MRPATLADLALGCRPADLTWRASIDVASLGATKNGALSAEAIVSFVVAGIWRPVPVVR